MKMQLQTAAVESKALESQISSYVNLQVLYDELKSDHAKLLRRLQEDQPVKPQPDLSEADQYLRGELERERARGRTLEQEKQTLMR